MQHIQRREQNPIDPPKNADTSKRLMEIIPQGANLGTICLSVGEVTVGSDQDYACRRYVVVEWLRICRVLDDAKQCVSFDLRKRPRALREILYIMTVFASWD